MLSHLLPNIIITEAGIQITPSQFVSWDEITSAKYRRLLSFEHILVEREANIRRMIPLYLNSNRIYEQTKLYSPEENPFRVELLKHPIPKHGLERYLAFIILLPTIVILLVIASKLNGQA